MKLFCKKALEWCLISWLVFGNSLGGKLLHFKTLKVVLADLKTGEHPLQPYYWLHYWDFLKLLVLIIIFSKKNRVCIILAIRFFWLCVWRDVRCIQNVVINWDRDVNMTFRVELLLRFVTHVTDFLPPNRFLRLSGNYDKKMCVVECRWTWQ